MKAWKGGWKMFLVVLASVLVCLTFYQLEFSQDADARRQGAEGEFQESVRVRYNSLPASLRAQAHEPVQDYDTISGPSKSVQRAVQPSKHPNFHSDTITGHSKPVQDVHTISGPSKPVQHAIQPSKQHLVSHSDTNAGHSKPAQDFDTIPAHSKSVNHPDTIAAYPDPLAVSTKSVQHPRLVSLSGASDQAQHPPKAYAVALKYAGQQGSGIRSLSVLQCVLSSIHKHFYIVEPYIEDSHMWTYSKAGDRLKFSSLFDYDHFSARSNEIGYTEMVTFREFSKFGPNKVIFVIIREEPSLQYLVWPPPHGTKSHPSCLDDETTDKLVRPYDSMVKGERARINNVKPQSCIVRVVELRVTKVDMWNSVKQHVRDVREFIFAEWSPEEVTVVFSQWYHKLFLPVKEPLNGIDCMHEYAKYETKTQFRPSQRLLEDAKRYEDMFMGGQNRLAIMLRVERVIKHYFKEIENDPSDTRPHSLKKCFSEVVKLKEEINRSGPNPMVTMDIGTYGTCTFHQMNQEIANISKGVVMKLYGYKWSIEKWEASFVEASRGEGNKGYIAALQRIVASRADCLILMGGGSFQALAVHDYAERHGSKMCVHLVCAMTQKNVEVQKVIEKYS